MQDPQARYNTDSSTYLILCEVDSDCYYRRTLKCEKSFSPMDV